MKIVVGLLSAVLFLTSCAAEWGYKLPTSAERFTAVPADRVEILFGPPARPFKQIGIVSVLGGAFSSDVAMYKKLRKAAADLGADAVIVSGQSQSFAGMSSPQTTVFTGNTATTFGGFSAFSYPKNQGIAIKY